RPYIAEEVKCRIASNIETLNQMRRLQYLAERDHLSGMYNRRAFFERAQTMLAQVSRKGAAASLAIIDIDGFRKITDTYGHDEGDHVVQTVAKVIHNVLARYKTLSARFGGEEFVVLLAEMSNEEAVAVAEDLRLAIAQAVILHNQTKLQVTVSIGVAVAQPGETLANNLNAADQMLYMAKEKGHDRVCADAEFYRTA
ncbi:MAG: GGDEF domain-containing protein, partial [Novosphingobium sp.]